MKSKYLILVIGTMTTIDLAAQDSLKTKSNFVYKAYVEAYYSYDFSKPGNHLKPSFVYNHNRSNEFNINLAMVGASYNSEDVRANVALMAGTYAQYNLVAEPALLQYIYEANIGVKIAKKNNLWIDAGIMPSHIGYESVISKDNWTLTRSIAAENSPYYETGAKISYTTKNEKLLVSGLLLNGWQRTMRPDGNNTIAFGTQLLYKPSGNIILNWSTFVGNNKPDSIKQMRFFNNLYGIFNFTNKLGLTAGFDIGIEQQPLNKGKYYVWYTPTVVARYLLNAKWTIAARGEYYNDKHGVIITYAGDREFKVAGFSLNADYLIRNNICWRTEIKKYNSHDPMFLENGARVNSNTSITTSLSINF